MASDTGLKLVLFDFDGTLCDSASTIVRLMKQAASDIDIELPSETVIRGNIGFGVDHVALEYA
ncbi:MAG: HAD family hydrolase, partial [Candidatus Puniceispirillaceae bacterium]